MTTDDFSEMRIAPAPPAAGHNQPPVEPPRAIELVLLDQCNDLLNRATEFETALVKVPDEIDGQEAAAKVADFVSMATAAQKRVADRKEVIKRPIIETGRKVDGFFNDLSERFAKVKRALLSRAEAYDAKLRAEAARKRAEEEARLRQVQERQRQAAEALAAQGKMAEAAAVAEVAQSTQAKADTVAAAPVEQVKMTGTFGGSISTRKTWGFTIADKSKVPLAYMEPNETLIRAWMNSETKAGRTPEMPGVKFEQTSKAVGRS